MASSFAFHRSPRRLLHTETEPQWFAPSERERESSLDTLERQEQAQRSRVRVAVLPEAPDPIGVAGAPEDRHKHHLTQLLQSNSQQQDISKMDPCAGGGMNVCFWDKYRSRHEELQRSLVTTSGRSFPTTISGRRKSEDDHLTGAAMVGDSVVRETEQPPHQHQVW